MVGNSNTTKPLSLRLFVSPCSFLHTISLCRRQYLKRESRKLPADIRQAKVRAAMEDLDEDAIYPPSSSQDPSTNADQDISDETQDFRFLSNLSLCACPDSSIPLPQN